MNELGLPQTRKTFCIWSLLILRCQGISVYSEVMPCKTFLFARLFLQVNFIGIFFYYYTNNARILARLTENRKLPPLSPTHIPSSTPACFSCASCVNTEGVFSLSFFCIVTRARAHTHICRYVLSSYPERKPYRILSLQLCLINSVSSWLHYSPSPLSFSKDNLACRNHVNLPLPSGGNVLRKL